jgi:DNA repair exonuclease SbcCD ATPase subunit
VAVDEASPELSGRLDALVAHGRALELEGLPFPTDQVREMVQTALDVGDTERASQAVRRGETLYQKASSDWGWLRGLLERVDEIRDLAQKIGLDVDHLTARVGDPRAQLKSGTLSTGALEKAAASASLALAVLSDAVPKYCVLEARKYGESIRAAEKRGEDVREVMESFRQLLRTLQEEHSAESARALLELRSSVLRIPKAPVILAIAHEEEEEILDEARNLARRLHRIKGRARDAQSAARLMAQVRAALSEDRRYGSPEEEIEELWKEVDRLTAERKESDIAPAAPEPPDYAQPPPSEFDPPPDDPDTGGPPLPPVSTRRSRTR